MTRTANPKSKTKQIVLIPKPEWEVELKAFRELHARNKTSMSETIMKKAIRPYLQEHHWPPGNSQTIIDIYEVLDALDVEWGEPPKQHDPYGCGELEAMGNIMIKCKRAGTVAKAYCRNTCILNTKRRDSL